MAMDYAERLKQLSQKHGMPLIFKASFDKANRTSIKKVTEVQVLKRGYRS